MRGAAAAALFAVSGLTPTVTEPPPVFTRREDGSVVVDRWSKRIEVSKELIANPTCGFLVRDGATLRFTVANGSATYEVLVETSYTVWAGLVSGQVH